MSDLTLTEWIQNELYSELCHMPLWTLSAWGSLEEGDVLKDQDVRIQLLKYLIVQHKQKAPDSLKLSEEKFKVSDFVPCVKAAVFQCKKILAREDKQTESPPGHKFYINPNTKSDIFPDGIPECVLKRLAEIRKK